MTISTHNTTVMGNSPCCPAQFLKSIEQPATPGSITESALELNNLARAVCMTLSINASDEPDLTFNLNSEHVIYVVDAICNLLEQQHAILKHPTTTEVSQ